MLHNSLSESMKITFPSLSDTFQALKDSIHAYEDIGIAAPLYTLYTDIGAIPELDLSLIQSLLPVLDLPSDNIWKLFPVASSLIFISDRWDSANYNLTIEGFEHNEHCIMLGITNILLCLSANDNILNEFIALKRPSLTANGKIIPRNAKQVLLSGLEQFQLIPKSYLHISSQILLYLRSQENPAGEYRNKKLRSTTLLMEYFIKYINPILDRNMIEKYFPYVIIHSSLTDVSLMRFKLNDSLGTFCIGNFILYFSV